MSLVVMKFGGTSVKGPERLGVVADKAIQYHKKGDQVVVVVSAPSGMTDSLIAMAQEICENPDEREMDVLLATGEQVSISLLSMAIKARGMEAVSMTGPQAGIYADSAYTKAKITNIRPDRIFKQLKAGKIVIVAGFQGLNSKNEVVTLGRGGSDLTAVALAAAMKADVCEIYTDVTGIFTADPRLVPEARKLKEISYDEILELAGAGAKVMQARSVEVGKKYNIPIHVRSSFNDEEGTMIIKEVPGMENVVVAGVALDKKQAKISLEDIPDQPGIAAQIFEMLAKEGVNVDMIIQSSPRDNENDISFTVPQADAKAAMAVLTRAQGKIKAAKVECDDSIAKLSVVGVGMRSHTGVAAKLFSALSKAKINIDMISTSEIKIACVIKEADGERALRLTHKTFGLDKGKNR